MTDLKHKYAWPIIDACCEFYNVTQEELCATIPKTPRREVFRCRHAIAELINSHTYLTHEQSAKLVSRSRHTVTARIRDAGRLLGVDKDFRREIDQIKSKLIAREV